MRKNYNYRNTKWTALQEDLVDAAGAILFLAALAGWMLVLN